MSEGGTPATKKASKDKDSKYIVKAMSKLRRVAQKALSKEQKQPTST